MNVPNIENITKPELMIDYVRHDLNLARNKLSLAVDKAVSSESISSITMEWVFLYPESTDELHANDCKRKDDGVFNIKYHWLRALQLSSRTLVEGYVS